MKNIIVEKIEKEIERLLEELTKVDPSSEDYKEITSRIGDLYLTLNKEGELNLNKDKVEIERQKVEGDSLIRVEELNLNKDKVEIERQKVEDDSLIRVEDINQNKLWNGIKTGAEVLGVIAPLVFYGIWMNRGLQFEEEGSFTSTTFKGLIGKFKPTK